MFLFFPRRLSLIVLLLLNAGPGVAQKLVDPSAVAPEFREAAEKRRAEQVKQRGCHQKADEAKVMLRDRTAFVAHCMDN